MRPFTRDEAPLFFGREKQTADLIERLAGTRFVAVVGPSGCGKSSLLQAGLLPGLETEAMPGPGPRWRVAEMRPGTAPFAGLAEALARTDVGPEKDGTGPGDALSLEARLRRSPLSLREILEEHSPADGANLLVLVDQFEDLFRYAAEPGGALPDASAFAALLLASATPRPLPDGHAPDRVYVVLAMRTNFIGDCARFPDLARAVDQGFYLTPRLNPDQLREAIEKPAAVAGGDLDPALVQRLLEDAGHDRDPLPLLQHALQWMWMRRAAEAGAVRLSLDDYKAGDGSDADPGKLLSDRMSNIFNALPPDRRRAAEILFRNLGQRAGEEHDIRRPVRLGDAADLVRPGNREAGMAELRSVVTAFSAESRNFLTWTPDGDLGPDSLLDVRHESLPRHWEGLREWLADEAKSAGMYELLEKEVLRQTKGKGEGGTGIDLAAAHAWWKEKAPTREWAMRYGREKGIYFDRVNAFLRDGFGAKVRARQRKTGFFAVLFLLVSVAAGHFWISEKERTTELYESRLCHAGLLARGEAYAQAREVLDQTRPLDADMPPGSHQARNLLDGYTRLMGGEADKVYEGAGAPLMDVAVSPDGRLLAAVGERATVAVFDETTGEMLKRLEGHDPTAGEYHGCVRAAVFHPESRWLATAGDDRRIILWAMPGNDQRVALWATPGGEKLREWEAPDQVWAMSLSPDATLLATGGTDNVITLWDPETGEPLHTLEGHTDSVSGLVFSPDGRRLASASYDRTARIWDVETGKPLHVLRGSAAQTQLAFHPDGNLLATSGAGKQFSLWDADTGEPRAIFRGHENYVFGLGFLDEGRRLVSGSMDRTLRVWDADTGVTLRVLQGHTAGIGGDGIKTHNDAIYSAANDGTVRRWRAEIPGLRVKEMPGEPNSCAIAPDGASIAVGSKEGALGLYRLPELTPLWEKAEAHTDRTFRLSFSPDGKFIASASLDNTVKLWCAADGEPLQTFTGHKDVVHAVAFSPDGRHIASASFDGRIGLFEVGQKEGRFYEAHGNGEVNSVAFSENGHLLSVGDNGGPRLWRITTDGLEPVLEFPKSTGTLMWAAISRNGRQVAAVGRDQVLRVYDAATGQETHAFTGHEQTIYRAEFTPDDRQVVTVAADGTVRFWDLKTNGELFAITLPTSKAPPVPAWDFSFRVTPAGAVWLAVPLTRGKVVVYEMGTISR